VERRKIPCTCREPNPNFSVVQPVANHRLRYPRTFVYLREGTEGRREEHRREEESTKGEEGTDDKSRGRQDWCPFRRLDLYSFNLGQDTDYKY
jgi:hypothetical protein